MDVDAEIMAVWIGGKEMMHMAWMSESWMEISTGEGSRLVALSDLFQVLEDCKVFERCDGNVKGGGDGYF